MSLQASVFSDCKVQVEDVAGGASYCLSGEGQRTKLKGGGGEKDGDVREATCLREGDGKSEVEES